MDQYPEPAALPPVPQTCPEQYSRVADASPYGAVYDVALVRCFGQLVCSGPYIKPLSAGITLRSCPIAELLRLDDPR